MQITLRQLEIFAAIYQEGTITGAAQRIGLSQAATSQALAELENQLQRRLFDRNGRRIVGNTAGRELLPAAILVLDRVRDIAAGAGHRPLNLKLCASLTVGTVYATSGFEFYAGILGVSQPNNVTVSAIVGAGSVVTRDVPANVIAAGNPARVMRAIEGEGSRESSACATPGFPLPSGSARRPDASPLQGTRG